ncbi:carbohydrate sulfotransferase 12-like [Anguilla rostrata]|uniref:carbohydrate sulfotransferase 12-like n=1 Tax=Anguilla rostrata TaxID=7938 RepID=UPI0030D04225
MIMTCSQLGSDKMGKSRFFRNGLILGSVFMILLIIIYWDDVGAAHFYLHTTISGPQASRPPPISRSTPKHEAVENSIPLDIDAFLNQFLEGTSEPHQKTRDDNTPAAFGNASTAAGKPEDKDTSEEKRKRQDDRKQLMHDLCSINSTLDFPGKSRTFDDIPSRELDHLIVDDRHGIIYCYVPKVACSHWKRVMIVLSETLLVNGVPYRDPMDVPSEQVHDIKVHLTLNKFWKRYGKFSRHLMNVKLKNYTKFLFVRDPFVRLISAFRNKLEKANEDFYRRFSTVMLKRYGNYSNPPASVVDAFRSGIRPSFSHFIQYLLDPKTQKEKPFNEHWKQVYRLCHPCQINYDFIGKLETVDEDAEHLLRTLQVDNIIHFPPGYRNRTTSSWQRDWFSNIPYESTRKLYKLYEPDFKLFGYSKPEKLLNDL